MNPGLEHYRLLPLTLLLSNKLVQQTVLPLVPFPIKILLCAILSRPFLIILPLKFRRKPFEVFQVRFAVVLDFSGHFVVLLEFENVLHESISHQLCLGLHVQFFEQAQHIEELVIKDQFLHQFRVVTLIDQLQTVSRIILFVFGQNSIVHLDLIFYRGVVPTKVLLLPWPRVREFLSEKLLLLLLHHILDVLRHHFLHLIAHHVGPPLLRPLHTRKHGRHLYLHFRCLANTNQIILVHLLGQIGRKGVLQSIKYLLFDPGLPLALFTGFYVFFKSFPEEVVAHGAIEIIQLFPIGFEALNLVLVGDIVLLVVAADLLVHPGKIFSFFHLWNIILLATIQSLLICSVNSSVNQVTMFLGSLDQTSQYSVLLGLSPGRAKQHYSTGICEEFKKGQKWLIVSLKQLCLQRYWLPCGGGGETIEFLYLLGNSIYLIDFIRFKLKLFCGRIICIR